MARSFDVINYATRPNKSVERKMIVETLLALDSPFTVSGYRYIGFGSMWFSDFILVHRALHIDDMISIEQDVSREDRAKFNRPFKCVRVEMGSSSLVLPKLRWDDRRVICWLDYDGGLESSVLRDIDHVCRFAKSGSVVLATVNADIRTLEDDGTSAPSSNAGSGDPTARAAARAKVLSGIAGDAFPTDTTEITYKNASDVIATVLHNQMVHSTRQSGRNLQYMPVFNFSYSDGVSMVTVGGLVVDGDDAKAYKNLQLSSRLTYLTAPQQYRIDVPHLTAREKLTLDQRLPHTRSPTVKDIGFTVPTSKIDAYRELYRFYPLYGELLF